MATLPNHQSSAAAPQQSAKESLLDEVVESAGKLVSKLLKLLVNTRCFSAEEGDEGPAYIKSLLSDVADLVQQVATPLPGEVKSAGNVPIGDPNGLEQVRLPLSGGESSVDNSLPL